MKFSDLQKKFDFIEYTGQLDSNVTYCFVYKDSVSRLVGESDILYIGKTEQPIKKRYKQETNTQFSEGNSQKTNIRTTFIYNKLGLENVSCFYTKALTVKLEMQEYYDFLDKLMAFDIQYRSNLLSEKSQVVDLEKYLLVTYGIDHLELPPMNNRF